MRCRTGGEGLASAIVNITVEPPPTTVSLFSGADTPAILSVPDNASVNLGVQFVAAENGTIAGIKFYKGVGDAGAHVGSLWTTTGTLLASTTFANETTSGWQVATFSNPIQIAAGTTYVASYHSNGYYTATGDYFTVAHTNGPLTALAGAKGVFAYGASNAFPASSYHSSNYWVDVLFDPADAGPNQPPLAVNDSGFTTPQDTPLSIAASSLLANDRDPNGDPLTVTGVAASSGGTASYDSQAGVITFTPTTGYTGPASFAYTVSDGRGGAATGAVALDVRAPLAGQGLFSGSSTLDIASVNDRNPVELGMKFQSDVAGTISAIQFFKGPDNTGSHDVHLWTNTGTLLAAASSTNETASGWQTVELPQPVAIDANTLYVASYHTSSGLYSATGGFFNSDVVSGNLSAPSSASSNGNGVYAYGSDSSFPSNTFNGNNYGVDVVFRHLAA